jgi:Rieske Fe-S protein
MKKKSRRTFFKLVPLAIISIIGIAWNKLTINHLEQFGKKVRIFPLNKHKTVSFYEDFIVINKNESIRVLSAKCTHLGCTINKVENERLLCPCHGSEYDLDGNAIKGPAYKNLEFVPARIKNEGEHIEIEG